MRIIAGRFRRRVIKAPSGSNTRPTTDRARESMFNMVSARINLTNSRVLDLFAGSGALGLEAMSRGATYLDLVDRDRSAISVAKENTQSLDPDLAVTFHQMDVFGWIKSQSAGQYQLILADPPYELVELGALVELTLPLLVNDGLFVLEHSKHVKVDSHPGFKATRFCGKSAVSLFSQPLED